MLSLVYTVIFDSLEDLSNNQEKFYKKGSVILLQDKNAIVLCTGQYLNKIDLFKDITHTLSNLDHYQIYNIHEESCRRHKDNKTLDDIIDFLNKRGVI